jgi:hypothetical protein
MTREEYRKELARDPQLRRAIAVINKHYGAPQPIPIWRRVVVWAVVAALVLLVIKIASAWN